MPKKKAPGELSKKTKRGINKISVLGALGLVDRETARRWVKREMLKEKKAEKGYSPKPPRITPKSPRISR